jgi:hypothetical protein
VLDSASIGRASSRPFSNPLVVKARRIVGPLGPIHSPFNAPQFFPRLDDGRAELLEDGSPELKPLEVRTFSGSHADGALAVAVVVDGKQAISSGVDTRIGMRPAALRQNSTLAGGTLPVHRARARRQVRIDSGCRWLGHLLECRDRRASAHVHRGDGVGKRCAFVADGLRAPDKTQRFIVWEFVAPFCAYT